MAQEEIWVKKLKEGSLSLPNIVGFANASRINGIWSRASQTLVKGAIRSS
jgi:hypothetical protein